MAAHEYLTSAQLFAVSPFSAESEGSLQDYSYVTKASFPALINTTYFELLRGEFASVAEILAVWEIRLSLLLFSDQLVVAKREAVSLNNALYYHENPGSGPSIPSKIITSQTHKPGDNSVANSNSTPSVVMPLPNNNDGQIPDSLLALLLSLKAAPNLARVHELYRLCYQRRLKGAVKSLKSGFHNRSETGLQAQLMALAYSVMAVLLVSRNYSTLVSFVDSMRGDLSKAMAKENDEKGQKSDISLAYHSNLTFVWLVAKIHVRRGASSSSSSSSFSDYEMWGPLYDAKLREIGESTWTELSYVTTKIAPQLNGNLVPFKSLEELDSVSKLAQTILKDDISVRTLCCLLGLWSVAATTSTGAKVSYENNILTMPVPPIEDSDDNALVKAYRYVQGQWATYFNKLYGLE